MQMILDLVVATVIAGTILLITLAVEFRGQQASVAATQYQAAKKGILSAVEWLEQDMNNLGSGFSPATDAIQHLDTTSSPREFSFYARTDSATATAQLVTYEWEASESVVLENTSPPTQVPLYEFRRFIDGALAGTTPATFTKFDIHLLDRDSVSVTANLEDTRQVFVELAAISPLTKGSFMEQTRWNAVFRPVNLTMRP